MKVLLFEVDDKRFGVRSENVREVARAVKLSPLPTIAAPLEGLLNFRGSIVPVVDVRAMFEMPAREVLVTDHLIILQTAHRLWTLRVDRATDLVDLEERDVQQDAFHSSRFVESIGKVGDQIVHVLDVSEIDALDQVRAAETSDESRSSELSP